MPVCSNEILELAEAMMASNVDETRARTAIGRSYYAAYHEAQAAAAIMELPCERSAGGAHDQLISRYRAQGKRLRVVADRLHRAKLMRVKADYYIDSEITEKDAQVHVAQCGQLVADLQRLAEASAPQVGSV